MTPEQRIDVEIGRAAERAAVELRAHAAAIAEYQNRSFGQLRRQHRERCAAARYKFRRLFNGGEG